jgi:hypothetical protein
MSVEVNISGGNNMNHFGHGDQHQSNYNGKPATVDNVFGAVRESLQELPEADRDEFESKVVGELRTMAKMPADEQRDPTIMERAQVLFDRLSPFAPKINKAVLAFGEASLSSLASRNPIIQGLLAAVKSLKS